jgi:uncharacterized protein YycO
MTSSDKTYSKPYSFRSNTASAGDIIFVYNDTARGGDKVKEFINVNGQQILASLRKTDRLKREPGIRKYSHVMLGMKGGHIIHADGKTVAIEVLPDALRIQTNETLVFQIYRRKDISQDVADKIVESAKRYYKKKYQFLSYFAKKKEGDTTQFCSKLVSYAYRSAGIQLTSLPDNKVLPVDLYQICQTDEWVDVTAEFIEKPLSPIIDEMYSPIMIPGKGEMSLSEFLTDADAMLLEHDRFTKRIQELDYYHVGQVMQVEALLAKSYSHQFESAKLIYREPSKLKGDDATHIIVRVLEQLQDLLKLSQLPSIELRIQKSYLNTVEEGQSNISRYVGYLSPLDLYEMQKLAEMIRIFSFLIFAMVGLCTILAHYTPFEEFKRFRVVKSEYAEQFFSAVPPIIDLSPYENEKDLFKWVEGEEDRATSQKMFHDIIATLEIIKILRNGGSKND